MKISYNEATAMKRTTLENDLKLCEKIGYDFIEIRFDLLAEYLKGHTLSDLAAFFKNHRIKPHALNALYDVNFCNERQLELALKTFKFACEVCSAINNNYLIVVSTFFEKGCRYTDQEVLDDSVAILNELSRIGEPYGMNIAWEPVGTPGWTCRSIKQSWDHVKAVNKPNVGITLDAFNLYLYDELKDVDDIKLIDSDKIFAVHIDDSEDRPIAELDHCHRLFPGDGILDLKRFMSTIKSTGYDGMVSVETFRPEYWERDVPGVIQEGFDKTVALLNQI